MAKKKVADLTVDTLAGAAVERIYGVSGDSLDGNTDSIRRHCNHAAPEERMTTPLMPRSDDSPIDFISCWPKP
jgi:hypothetical protein